MKKILLLVSLILAVGSSVYAAELKDISGYEFEKEILILQSLNIAGGDENGYFNPNERVKRSEAAKLIDEAFSYSGTPYEQTDTEFSDVSASHWASGYIKAAADRAFINGMGDGTFAPDADITYAQAATIIMKALGYEPFAESFGGYPNGYIQYAQSFHLSDKIAANNDSVMTRGELAYMIANALETPVTEFTADNRYLNIMQGRGTNYLCPLIKYHKAYFVNGKITGTYRGGAAVKKGYVELEIDYAKRLGNEYINLPKTIVCNTADGDAVYDLLYLKGDFILKQSGDDEYTIIMIIV